MRQEFGGKSSLVNVSRPKNGVYVVEFHSAVSIFVLQTNR